MSPRTFALMLEDFLGWTNYRWRGRAQLLQLYQPQIGRASCRERV